MHALPGAPGGGGLVTDAGATRRTIGARAPEQACRSPFSGRLQISFLLSVEMERPPGIEPGSSAWKADARPIGQGRMCRSPLRTYGQCHRGNAVRELSSSAAHAEERPPHQPTHGRPRLDRGANEKARKARTVRALDVSFHLLLTEAATGSHRSAGRWRRYADFLMRTGSRNSNNSFQTVNGSSAFSRRSGRQRPACSCPCSASPSHRRHPQAAAAPPCRRRPCTCRPTALYRSSA